MWKQFHLVIKKGALVDNWFYWFMTSLSGGEPLHMYPLLYQSYSKDLGCICIAIKLDAHKHRICLFNFPPCKMLYFTWKKYWKLTHNIKLLFWQVYIYTYVNVYHLKGWEYSFYPVLALICKSLLVFCYIS